MIIQCDKCYRFDSYLTISNDYVLCPKCLRSYKDLQGYYKYLANTKEKIRLKSEKKNRRNLYKIQMTLPWYIKPKVSLKPKKTPIFNKKTVLESLKEKHGNQCFYCNSPDPTTIDHVIPRSKGGTNKRENLRPCCLKCNGIKSDLSVEQFKRIVKW